jgi:hypothetical protein
MNNRRTKLLPKIVLGQLGVALIIAILGFSVLFYAEGYRINFKTWEVSRIGILYVSSIPKSASVYVNNTFRKTKTPFNISLDPGVYTVQIQKKGYVSWEKNVKVESTKVSSFENIVLFKNNIEPQEIIDQKKIASINEPISILSGANKGLYYNSHEIWVNNSIVARFSEEIQRAVWYSDNNHVVYQQGNKLRIIQLDGTYDLELISLSNETPTNFAVSDNGNELYFYDNGKYYSAIIR